MVDGFAKIKVWTVFQPPGLRALLRLTGVFALQVSLGLAAKAQALRRRPSPISPARVSALSGPVHSAPPTQPNVPSLADSVALGSVQVAIAQASQYGP